jgi:hypothetical protein
MVKKKKSKKHVKSLPKVAPKKSLFGTKNFTVMDIGFIKGSVFLFTLFIVSFLSENAIKFIKELRWIWFIFFILFAIKPLKKSLRR